MVKYHNVYSISSYSCTRSLLQYKGMSYICNMGKKYCNTNELMII